MRARAKARSVFVAAARRAVQAFNAKRLRLVKYDVIRPYADLLLTTNELGETFVIDSKDAEIGKTIYRTGSFDFKKVETVISALGTEAPKLLVDVGANIGPICIPALKRGLFDRCIAIEPHPRNCNLLRANIALNDLHDKIEVHQCAVGSKPGETLSLELSPDNFGDHRVRVVDEPGMQDEDRRSIISVPSTTLDYICAQAERSLIWIDTQGYEGFVLLGASRLLDRKNPFVLEFWPYAMRRSGAFPHMVSALRGYTSFYDLDHETKRPITDMEDLYREIGDVDPYAFTDILVV